MEKLIENLKEKIVDLKHEAKKNRKDAEEAADEVVKNGKLAVASGIELAVASIEGIVLSYSK